MKIVNLRNILRTTSLLLFFLCITFVLTNSMSFGLLKKENKTNKKENADKYKTYSNINQPRKSVFFEGWIKYLHYSESEKNNSKGFFRNSLFKQQQSNPKMKNFEKKDKNGISLKIPSESHFFSIVYNDSLNILNSRMDVISRFTDILNFDYIDPIPDKKPKAGGVIDNGKFNEGFCIKINTKVPTKTFIQTAEKIQPAEGEYSVTKWIICSDSQEQKDKLYKLLIELKLKRQHEKNIYIELKNKEPSSENENSDKNNLNNLIHGKSLKSGSIYEGGESPNDCKMIILQNWTPCSLSCGGGFSFLQLMKISAKNGGMDCKTKDTVLKRPCNTHACPTEVQITSVNSEIKKLQSVAKQNNHIIPVKTIRISKRPQRYDKCKLKESDALMEKKDETTLQSLNLNKNTEFPLITVRLVMNDKTLSAFYDDNLSDRISTFMLGESTIIKTDDIRRCFIVKNNVSSEKFCMLNASKGDFLEEWFYDFNLFKHQCKKEREKSNKFSSEEKKLEEEYKEKVDKIKIELIQQKSEAVKKSFNEHEKKDLENKINKYRKMSISALSKELRLENLFEKEEELKEQSESDALLQQIAQEKKKEELLIKAIKEKELESQINIAKFHAERAIDEIKKNTQQEILKQRQLAVKKLKEMRLKNKRKHADLKNQISSIRSNMAYRLKTVNKKGDKAKCVNNLNIESYCNTNFSDNPIKIQECKSKESFCDVCCENEFGELHALERDQCSLSCGKI